MTITKEMVEAFKNAPVPGGSEVHWWFLTDEMRNPKAVANVDDVIRRGLEAAERAGQQQEAAPPSVTAASIKRILIDTLEVQVQPNNPKDVPGISDESINEAADAIKSLLRPSLASVKAAEAMRERAAVICEDQIAAFLNGGATASQSLRLVTDRIRALSIPQWEPSEAEVERVALAIGETYIGEQQIAMQAAYAYARAALKALTKGE